MKRSLATIMAVALLPGCTTHVHGAFSCGAPRGTCEPTMSIDDRALADIRRARGQDSAPEIIGQLAAHDDAEQTGYPVRRAKVVFAGYVDAKGRTHEPYIVYMPVHDAWEPGAQAPAPGFGLLDQEAAPPFPAASAAPGLASVAAQMPLPPSALQRSVTFVGRVAPVPQPNGQPQGDSSAVSGLVTASTGGPQAFPASSVVKP